MTNEELAVKIKKGEIRYYNVLWEQCRKLLYKILAQYQKRVELPNYISCEDLEQCLYTALRAAVNSYDSGKGFLFNTYLRFHVMNAVKAQLPDQRIAETSANQPVTGKDGENTELIEFVADDGATLPFKRIEIHDMQRHVRQAVRTLPNNQKEIIIMIFYKGMTYRQMQTVTGQSISRLSAEYRKAIQTLRNNKVLQELSLIY